MTAAHAGPIYSHYIVEALTRHRAHDAFVCGERRVTYAETASLTARFVEALRARGVSAGTGVAVLSPNVPEAWMLQAATYLLGARFVGLHPLGSAHDHVWVCDDAEASVLIVAPVHLERGLEVRSRAQSVHCLLTIGPAEGAEDVIALADGVGAIGLSAGPAGPADTAALQYTGGTTGTPKGVMMSHGGMAQQVESWLCSYSVPEQPRYLAASPITHAGMLPILPTLLRGGTVVLHKSFDPDAWLRTVQDQHINLAFAVPTMLYALCDYAHPDKYDLSPLKTVIYGASPMNPSRIPEVMDQLGNVLFQAYASTETSGVTMGLRKEEHIPELYSSCGRPALGVRAELLDEDGQPVEVGQVGEICVQSRSVMAGYWKQPELTAEALRNGFLHTGDLARRDERGFYHIVDRLKDLVVSGGFNVYPKEVEDAIARHSSVAAVAVIGVPDGRWGEAVKAFVVTREGETASAEEIIEIARKTKGAHYAPKSVDFISEMPLTPVGKPDKKALRRPFWGDKDRQVH
jgi:fatty-acyl-CoA synthase